MNGIIVPTELLRLAYTVMRETGWPNARPGDGFLALAALIVFEQIDELLDDPVPGGFPANKE